MNLSITLLAVLAWLNATNHCAVAMISDANVPQKCHATASAPTSHSEDHCCGHHKPPQKNDSKDSAGCCNDFPKAAQNTDSAPQFKNVGIKLLTFFNSAQILPVAPKADLDPNYLDSGPPQSFAASPRHRSHLTHAPPAVA